jgi:hypothetical protein
MLRQAACPQEGRRSVTGRDEDAVGRARMQVHVVIERRSEAVQPGPTRDLNTGAARRGTKPPPVNDLGGKAPWPFSPAHQPSHPGSVRPE